LGCFLFGFYAWVGHVHFLVRCRLGFGVWFLCFQGRWVVVEVAFSWFLPHVLVCCVF
jgi:hypothetical protein